MKKRILSGMRPTGPLHLGHLTGALNNWVKLQKEYDCYYMIADWHALMSEYQNPKSIEDNILGCAADWIACGIDPDKATVFVQSDVSEHLELSLVLSCLTPLSWLERCPTYKEQLREIKSRDLTTYAFLGYPVLQAADILVYKANVVPVGIDQSAHLEITREIARRFNNLYGNLFPEPQTLLTASPKLLGIDARKMSKSYGNYIALSDSPDVILEKTKKMFTDPKRVYKKDPGHPDQCNVFSYIQIFSADADMSAEMKNLCKKAETGCTDCKKKLAEMLIETLKPLREKRDKLIKEKGEILKILKKGREKAKSVAVCTMEDVKKKIAFLDLKK